ncbi:mediator of RNA polymerase II transcription subunit 25 [Culicoides brevitarsis]|uniref:mediator of RNA polymerase II transcription subunit 25 n=1 Tax=Culicoides brevitarsis TaxID=469753 RepID=UPI00307C7684
MVVAPDAPCDVIFIVEQTSQMGAYIQDIKANYISDTVEFFSKCTNTRYGIVSYKTAQGTLSSAVNTFGPFSKTANVLETFDKIDFSGGKSESNACLAEGLATALVCFEDLEQIRENGSGSNKFCVLICHSAPYQMPVLECVTYENKTCEQLSTIFQENNVNLSIISPRKIPVFFKLFEKAGGDASATTKNYAKDVRHLVLLKGFALSERSPSPNAGAAVPTNVPMVTNDAAQQPNQISTQNAQQQGILQPPEGQMTPNQQVPNPQVPNPNQVPNANQQVQQSQQQQMMQMAQMRAQQQAQQAQIQQQQQNPVMGGMRPMMSQQGNPQMGQITQQQQQMMAAQQQMAAARQQNPRWARAPNPGMAPNQFMNQQGFPGQPQTAQGQMMNQPGSALQQQLQGNNPQSQQLRMQLMQQNQQNVQQMQQGQAQGQMNPMNQGGGMQGTQGVNMGGQPGQQQQVPNAMGVPNQMATQQPQIQGQIQGQIQNTAMQNPMQGQMSAGPSGNVAPQQQQTQQQQPQPTAGPQTQQRQRIWSGIVEWVEKSNKTDQTKVPRQAPFQVTANVKDGELDIRADHWPPRLLMQLMPKTMVGSAGGQYLKESKTVVFHPTQCEALESLSRVMAAGMAGCVHFNSAPQCDIIVLILLYSMDKKAFLGFIPNDQAAFVDRLKAVIMQNKQPQGGPQQMQQQQQMIQGVPQNPQMNMPGRMPTPGMVGMQQNPQQNQQQQQQQQQMDPNEQQWQMNQQQAMQNQQVMQNQPQMMGPGQGIVNPQQQRMVRPMMPNNPGLRHLLQQQQQPMRMGMRPPTQQAQQGNVGQQQYDEQNYDGFM